MSVRRRLCTVCTCLDTPVGAQMRSMRMYKRLYNVRPCLESSVCAPKTVYLYMSRRHCKVCRCSKPSVMQILVQFAYSVDCLIPVQAMKLQFKYFCSQQMSVRLCNVCICLDTPFIAQVRLMCMFRRLDNKYSCFSFVHHQSHCACVGGSVM